MENIDPQSNFQSESNAANICSIPVALSSCNPGGRNATVLFEEIGKAVRDFVHEMSRKYGSHNMKYRNDSSDPVNMLRCIGYNLIPNESGTCICTKDGLKHVYLMAPVVEVTDEKKGHLVTKKGKELPIGICCIEDRIINNPMVCSRLKEEASDLVAMAKRIGSSFDCMIQSDIWSYFKPKVTSVIRGTEIFPSRI